jgi:protein O-GlcNAc transferase
MFNRMDVALDTFPYAGGTTTCDALWMGVPVVTLAGRTAVGRGGVSILSNVGSTEFIAETAQRYVEIAVGAAQDLEKLAALRRTMRERMSKSALMDAKRFARGVDGCEAVCARRRGRLSQGVGRMGRTMRTLAQ